MFKAIALRDFYNRLEAFYDSDPLIRIAAIHHAGNKLERNPRLRNILYQLLNDREPLVARYAAVTLAQNGDFRGLQFFLKAISGSQGEERRELENCLRNCVRFPFAVLLNERILIESIPEGKDVAYREVLEKTLLLTSDHFYAEAEKDPSFRDIFLKIMCSLERVEGLRIRPDRFLDEGYVLSIPLGKQPGFLYCPSRKLFLKFQNEVVMNRCYLQRGRQTLFVGREGGIEVNCLYVLEDAEPCDVRPLLQGISNWVVQGGLLPGIVCAKESPDRAFVICANGRSFTETYRAQKSKPGQFVLVELETELGRPQCHFVPAIQLILEEIRMIVSTFAAFNNSVMAQVKEVREEKHPKTGHTCCVVKTEKGEELTAYVPAPRLRMHVLLGQCHVCNGSGKLTCDGCGGQGAKRCSGRFTCPRCDGSGSLDDGKDCVFCRQTGWVSGCDGDGTINCPFCKGKGKIKCNACNGTGEYLPRRNCPKCSGSGKFTVTCRKCNGRGRFKVECRKCGGSGRVGYGSCWSCGGSGTKTLKCTICEGRGEKILECTACSGQGYWNAQECIACSGQGSKECFYCHGDAQIQCSVCHGSGELKCKRCGTDGQVRCPYCRGNRLVFNTRLDCLPC